MMTPTTQHNDKGSFSFYRLVRGSLGLGAGTSFIAYLTGDETVNTETSELTVGEIAITLWSQIVDGYHHIFAFIASIDASTAGILGVGLAAIFAKLYNRRVTTTEPELQYFDCTNASRIPRTRIGYSDRMSYAMGELSQLAYIPAENVSHLFDPVVLPIKEWLDKTPIDDANKTELTELIDTVSLPTEYLENQLERGLKSGHFALVEPYLSNESIELNKHQTPNAVSKLSAQGFVCYHKNPETNKCFIVVSFRGSEASVEDWLTNVDAKPLIDAEIAEVDALLASDRIKYGFPASPKERCGRVHRGFYGAFLALAPQIMCNIQAAKKEIGCDTCPVYFTGHSLGGGMATIAARELLPDSNGAVYTFGAPRVADYNYFTGMKTPIFRIVNSSDIVPRVPPGVYSHLFKVPIYIVRWFFDIRQGVENTQYKPLAEVLQKVEKFTDDLSHYRHYGDLRYLTDVTASKEVKPEILSNPSKFDQIFWFFTSVGVSFGKPVKSHSMQIYRNKLKKIAAARNK